MKRLITWITLLTPLALHACAVEPAFAEDKPCPVPCVDAGTEFAATGILFLVLIVVFIAIGAFASRKDRA